MNYLRFAKRHRSRRLALGLLAVPGCLAACLMLAGTAPPASAGTAAPASARAAAPVVPHPVLAARYGAFRYLPPPTGRARPVPASRPVGQPERPGLRGRSGGGRDGRAHRLPGI